MFELNEENKNVYRIVSEKEVPEQNLYSVELEHIITKAKIILFICDDENRVFNIAFKTPVDNGKGTPHILEHSVLCGSRKYNVKDPFIELAKGSINTFLNAMTFPDKTCYPVASANLKDFHNLMDVYLDAVFYPNATKDDKIFKQEGWHYEIENENDDLRVNGVVYNEMKGVYSDPDSILESSILSNLFSGTNYEYESGGNPSEIINLTFEEFKSFHHKYYSASNSIIYLYGKLNYNEELVNLQKNYLKDMEYVDVNINFADVDRIIHNKEKIDYYNVDDEDNNEKSYLAYSFALPLEKNSLNYLVMSIIDYVLFKSESAILKEKLMAEGFGKTIDSHLDSEIKNSFYTIVSKEVNDTKKNVFIDKIQSFIRDMVETGLDIDKFKAGINIEYFQYAEGEYGRTPRGLIFSLMSLDTYLYDGSPITFIEYKEAFDYLKSIDLKDKNNIFIKTLKAVFLDNNWTAVNILKPKKDLLKDKDDKLAIYLKNQKDKLNSNEINYIINDVKELKMYQKEKDSDDSLRCIPKLKISDLEKYNSIIDYENKEINGTESIVYLNNDRDVVYVNFSFDISDFSKEEFYFVSLLTKIIGKIDLDNINYQDFNNYIDINTGGLDIYEDVFDNKCNFTFSIKSTSDKISIAFDIIFKLLSQVNFNDYKRIELLLNETKSISMLSILSSGHLTSMIRSSSVNEYNSCVCDKISKNGIGFYKFINEICKNYQNNYTNINKVLLYLFKKIIRRKMYLCICTNKKYYDNISSNFKEFNDKYNKFVLENIDFKNTEKELFDNIQEIKNFIRFDSFEKKANREAIITPNDVNFCAISGQFDKKLFSGKLLVLKTLFNYEYLWTNIRVLGGAYGCMSLFKKTGNYSLISYRDPNVSNTNKVFFDVPNFLHNINKNDNEIEQYIIGSIGTFDNPISTFDLFKLNIAAYFNNQTSKELNSRRQEVLNMKGKDLNDLEKIFSNINDASACALISENKIEEAKNEYDSVWRLIEN